MLSYIKLHENLQSVCLKCLTWFELYDLQIISKACELLKVFD